MEAKSRKRFSMLRLLNTLCRRKPFAAPFGASPDTLLEAAAALAQKGDEEARFPPDEVTAGKMTQAEAQAQFRARGRKMSFNNGQGYPVTYFADTTILLNGANPQLEGKITGAKDSTVHDSVPGKLRTADTGARAPLPVKP